MATDSLQIFGTSYTGVTGIKATDSSNGTKTYIRPQGTKSITANGTGIDVTEYASVDVSVGHWETLYDGSVYVTSGTPNYILIQNYTTPLLEDEIYKVTWNGTPYTCETGPVIQSGVSYDGYYIGNAHIVDSEYEDTEEPFFMYRDTATRIVGIPTASAGSTITVKIEKLVSGNSGTPNLQAKTNINPTTSSQTIEPDTGYDGLSSVQINGDANLVAGNIKSGTTIFGVTGNYAGSSVSLQAKTNISPTTSSQTITADNGYDGLSSVQINAMPTMTLPTSASSSATSGYTSKATISRSTSDQYINIPTGYNSAGAYYKVNAVANGSATGPSSLSGSSATVSTGTNTITLTKTGVTTTPTVSAGYVSAATSSTATVTLTASVTTKAAATITPGTTNQTIASGTYLTGTQTISGDSNLVASNIISGKTIFGVSGSVVIQHYYTGSGTPSAATGENGDIYLKTS